jgi:anhydro-N-acetylmuramic acid kinase
VSDLRTRDITRGGHGAPLASTLDALLLRDRPGRAGALNLGGIANITVLGTDGRAIAYDIGPANALVDAAVAAQSGGRYRMDRDGARAARGTVDAVLLQRLLAEPYYRLPPPKSTGKELFHTGYVTSVAAGVTGDDLVATLTELTAALVADACKHYELDELIVAGGGVRNPVLMARIAELAGPTRVALIDQFGLPAQGKEAYLFALLGFLTVYGLAGTIPSATGASAPSVLGSITPGDVALQLPEPADRPPTRLRIEP